MRTIRKIIFHSAYTPPDMDIGVEEIRRWHTDPPPKGNGWRDIGYHYLIRRDGTIEEGRPIEMAGAHVAGHNHDSIGIVLVGGKARDGRSRNNFTRAQWRSAEELGVRLTKQFPEAEVGGHNDYTNSKTCPDIDIKAWWYG